MQATRLLLLLTVALVLTPVLAVFSSWLNINNELWQHISSTRLPELIFNTLQLLLYVTVLVFVLGVSLAWVVTQYEFPGRRWLEWALMLPMAIPAYVIAFVFLELYDFTGPVQSWLRSHGFDALTITDIRHPVSVSLVIASVFYPYVYLLVRNAFLQQGSHFVEAASSLGAGSRRILWTVHFGMARPAIIAGLSLVIMETLADFGTVAIFNFDTFTLAIYKAWFDYFDLNMACQLASILLVLVFVALLIEQSQRGKKSYSNKHHQHQRKPLSGWTALIASGYTGFIFSICFLLPVSQLLLWTWQDIGSLFEPGFHTLLGRTSLLASMASVAVAIVATLLGILQTQRNGGIWRQLFPLAKLGYALPGTVLAVGIVMPLGTLEQWLHHGQIALGLNPQQLLLGSLLSLLIAYLVRFLTVAIGPIETSLGKIRYSLPEAARNLGANRLRVLYSIYLPLIRPGVMLAMLMVFVDVMKEMPATLLMRPFGWDTLAVRIYELTSEGEYQRAALPAVCLLLVGLIPLIIGIASSQQKDR